MRFRQKFDIQRLLNGAAILGAIGLAWAVERPDGGRGFGFTGAHFHKNWGNENFRKIVLNALLWTAHAEVPANGVECAVTEENLKKNLDPKGR